MLWPCFAWMRVLLLRQIQMLALNVHTVPSGSSRSCPRRQHSRRILLETPGNRRRAGRAADHRPVHVLNLSLSDPCTSTAPAIPWARPPNRDLLRLEQLVQALAVEARRREHQLGAGPWAAMVGRLQAWHGTSAHRSITSRAENVGASGSAAANAWIRVDGAKTTRPSGCPWCPRCNTGTRRLFVKTAAIVVAVLGRDQLFVAKQMGRLTLAYAPGRSSDPAFHRPCTRGRASPPAAERKVEQPCSRLRHG